MSGPANEHQLIENFNKLIRNARIKLGYTHKDLGRKIGEKVSLLKKLELGKIKPNNKLVKKLENILHIKLLEPYIEEKGEPLITNTKPKEVTIGDIIKIDKRREVKERRQ